MKTGRARSPVRQGTHRESCQQRRCRKGECRLKDGIGVWWWRRKSSEDAALSLSRNKNFQSKYLRNGNLTSSLPGPGTTATVAKHLINAAGLQVG